MIFSVFLAKEGKFRELPAEVAHNAAPRPPATRAAQHARTNMTDLDATVARLHADAGRPPRTAPPRPSRRRRRRRRLLMMRRDRPRVIVTPGPRSRRRGEPRGQARRGAQRARGRARGARGRARARARGLGERARGREREHVEGRRGDDRRVQHRGEIESHERRGRRGAEPPGGRAESPRGRDRGEGAQGDVRRAARARGRRRGAREACGRGRGAARREARGGGARGGGAGAPPRATRSRPSPRTWNAAPRRLRARRFRATSARASRTTA